MVKYWLLLIAFFKAELKSQIRANFNIIQEKPSQTLLVKYSFCLLKYRINTEKHLQFENVDAFVVFFQMLEQSFISWKLLVLKVDEIGFRFLPFDILVFLIFVLALFAR